jgi:hypothetical protein
MAGALVPKRGSSKIGYEEPVLFGVELRDAREELFVILVCDGLPMGLAFKRAGFESKANNAPSLLFNLPRVQERAQAILAARRETGAVSLPQVTDMLKRVFAGAHSEGEYSAAHNAAFSLARLYGHVTDRATLEVIRRPSRDPDAPSEQALGDWVAGLPVISGPGPAALGPADQGLLPADLPPRPDAPAEPLGPETIFLNNSKDLQDMGLGSGLGPSGPEPLEWILSNDIKGLGPEARGRTENGAPSGPVTVTPQRRARSGLLGPGGIKKRVLTPRQVPGTAGGKVSKYPSAKDLFG